MRVIIIGAGKLGFNIAEILSHEKHDVTVIEKDSERQHVLEDHLDVQSIQGSGASWDVLIDAGIKKADLLIAVTESDELNMVACLLAKQAGVKRTVARVRSPEYIKRKNIYINSLYPKANNRNDTIFPGIDLIINPEWITAMEIEKLINVPEARNVEYYAKGKIQLLEFRMDEKMPVVGKKLQDISLSYRYLIVAIIRENKMIIPGGNEQILPGDTIFLMAKTEDLILIEKFLGKKRKSIESVIIFGGGTVGFYLAKRLEKKKLSVKLMEKDRKRCEELSSELDNVMVLNGDATDSDLLKEENIEQVDAFIAVTNDDKLNLLVSLLSKSLGVKKTIAQVRRSDYLDLIEQVGVDLAVSPQILSAGAILRFVRRGNIVSVTVLGKNRAEMIELSISNRSRLIHQPLKKLTMPAGSLIGAIERANTVIIPSGDDEIKPGDRILIFALPSSISRVEKFFSD